ncbi:MAG: hypothetical protein EWV59_03770 [Microcystis aeruginosa Ma_MB_F_20061100_S19D]|nr:MAG: hypothetical protein EWV59_03770 [Microcystis aeruginosa Ma_MB_F_20061100_S19D]
MPIPHSDENCYSREDKYLSKINYTFRSSFCLLPVFTRKFILHDYLLQPTFRISICSIKEFASKHH